MQIRSCCNWHQKPILCLRIKSCAGYNLLLQAGALLGRANDASNELAVLFDGRHSKAIMIDYSPATLEIGVWVSICNELDYCGEEPSMSPRTPHQHQNSQPIPFTNSTFLVSSGSSGVTATAQGTRTEHCDQQPKNTVFSNALSSPIRRSLQNYHIAQGGYCPPGGSPSGNGTRNNEPNFLQHHNRDPNPPSSNDSSMDI
ncbi:unnamed protein product [Dovyalis caffra]|uniref:Uncharacterized protein n=1 Tax=Dovyalis caffra TaxID=77055 RepID=A0AAV1S797_9ROSI|nr:unnamed protein product [Dovyalis caffra]